MRGGTALLALPLPSPNPSPNPSLPHRLSLPLPLCLTPHLTSRRMEGRNSRAAQDWAAKRKAQLERATRLKAERLAGGALEDESSKRRSEEESNRRRHEEESRRRNEEEASKRRNEEEGTHVISAGRRAGPQPISRSSSQLKSELPPPSADRPYSEVGAKALPEWARDLGAAAAHAAMQQQVPAPSVVKPKPSRHAVPVAIDTSPHDQPPTLPPPLTLYLQRQSATLRVPMP